MDPRKSSKVALKCESTANGASFVRETKTKKLEISFANNWDLNSRSPKYCTNKLFIKAIILSLVVMRHFFIQNMDLEMDDR